MLSLTLMSNRMQKNNTFLEVEIRDFFHYFNLNFLVCLEEDAYIIEFTAWICIWKEIESIREKNEMQVINIVSIEMQKHQ